MTRQLSILIITIFAFINSYANAGDDGKLKLNENKNGYVEVGDCFEKVNRGVFAFNQALDKVIFKPLAKGYRMFPQPIRSGTSNALSNLGNVVTVPNNVLQGQFKDAGINSARFVINSTLGIAGIFDVASYYGLKKRDKEDYGQTLGSWGVGEGCYLVLPIFGPSTVRDLTGSLTSAIGGDPWYNITVRNDTQYFEESDYYYSRGGDGINFRAKNIDSFENLEKNSMDFYASVRSLYLQDRRKKIMNSNEIIDTQDDSEWDNIESQ